MQVSPAPSAEDLAEYYRGAYHEDHGPVPMRLVYPNGTLEVVEPTSEKYPDAIATMHRYRAQRVVADLGLAPGASVLEIGCSDGKTLAELQRLGMDVSGIEPDVNKAREANDRIGSADVYDRTLETMADEAKEIAALGAHGRKWDAVIAFHVLEHFHDPLAALAQMRTLLRPGGRVWFEVPNIYRPSKPIETFHFQWVHLFDFSPHTMEALLKRAGFDDVHTRGPLQAWATNGSSEPRAFEDHGGLNGADVAALLRAIENDEPLPVPTRVPGAALLAFREGKPCDHDEVRADLHDAHESLLRLAGAYQGAIDLLSDLAAQINDEAVVKLESWVPEEHVHYFVMGEAHQLWRVRSMLGHIAHSMVSKRSGDGR